MLNTPTQFPHVGALAYLRPSAAPVRILRRHPDGTVLIGHTAPTAAQSASGNQTVHLTTLCATLHEMQNWAADIMQDAPDFVIGDDYLRRWWVIPRNEGCNVYLHEIRKSDDDRALHDHPWANTSYLLFGGYIEHTPEGVFTRKTGDIIQRPAHAMHRLEVFDGAPAISLFITGPKVRDWGFDCPQGWVPWQDFTDAGDPSQVGRGCGEP